MSEQRVYKITDELIAKFFLGEITLEESDFIREALHDDAEKNNFIQKKALLEGIQSKLLDESIDTERELQSLIQTISVREGKQINLPGNGLKQAKRLWLKIAAAVILIFGVGLVWYVTSTPEDVILYTDNKSIRDIVLPDSSLLSLNKDTKVVYTKDFKSGSRELHLQKGEAYLKVKHDNNKPFTVNTPDLRVEVLGTEFDVLLNDTSEYTKVIVTSGKVQVEMKRNTGNGLSPVILERDRELTYYKKTNIIDTLGKPNQNSLYWKTGKFVFEDIPMATALQTIASEFNHAVNVVSPNVNNCLLTATINRAELHSIIKAIELSANIKATFNGDTIIVTGEGCEPIVE